MELAAGAGLLAGSWWGLRSQRVQRADVVAGEVVRRVGGPALDRVVVATTDLGSIYAPVGIAAVLAAADRRRSAADVLVIGGLGWMLSQSTKTRVRRARPYEADVEGVRRLVRAPTGSSFPSGHATVAAAWTALLAERVRPRRAATALWLLGLYVAATRVRAGVHYPTDALGGAGIGLLLAAGWRGCPARGGRWLVSRAGQAVLAVLAVLPPR